MNKFYAVHNTFFCSLLQNIDTDKYLQKRIRQMREICRKRDLW